METEKEKNKESAVVFYPSPGRSHLNPVVELSKLILKHHPSLSVTIITSSFPPDSPSLHSYASHVSNKYSINFIHLEAAPPLIPSDTNSDNFSASACGPARATREYVATMFEIPKLNNPALRDTLLMLSRTHNIRAFIMDYFCHYAFHVSSGLDLPTYYLRTQSALAAVLLLYFPLIGKTVCGSLKDLDPNFLVEFPGVPPIPCKHMGVAFTDRTHRLYNYFMDASAQLAKSNGLILNTFEALDLKILETIREGKCTPGESKAPPLYCVGPLITPHYDMVGAGGGDDNGCLTWLDSQPSESVLFLCFGRFGIFSSRQLKEMAIGLEKSKVRFLWVVRNPPEIATDEVEPETLLPQGFLERTKERGLVVKKWAPQFLVLSHGSVGGFMTHFGWSSVMEALCAGVPMLGWPLYAEQKMNRVYLVEGIQMALGLREEEDGWVSAYELEKKVTELMSSEKGKELKKRVGFMKQAASEALTDGGSSRIALAKLVHSFKP